MKKKGDKRRPTQKVTQEVRRFLECGKLFQSMKIIIIM
jgi:hypothetical protein